MGADLRNDDWLGRGFLRAAGSTPMAPALRIDGADVSYVTLQERAMRIAGALRSGPATESRLTAILGMHSVATYAGILGALFAGNGYVPLNPGFPPHRLAYMLRHAGCQSLVVDRAREPMLADILEDMTGLTLVFADRADLSDIEGQYPNHCLVAGAGAEAIAPQEDITGPAYVLYTSGSTGEPKGVAVSHANVRHFLTTAMQRLDLRPSDRFSHLFDLSFDLSVFDMFMAWEAGGCMCVPSTEDALMPAEYALREKVSVWFSVPSVAVLMHRLRQLEPGRFPDIRISLFCGEALHWDTLLAWAAAAPASALHNVYGPTEVTLACTWYECGERDEGDDVVPIGWPFAGLQARVVQDGFDEVPPGGEGELLIAGPQVALGYWRDPERTQAAFVPHPETGTRHYRTGDLVRRPACPSEPLRFLGRIDHQVKVHGHRIELGEIEARLRSATGGHRAVVLGWPIRDGQPQGLAAFVELDSVDEAATRAALARDLPDYMLPRTIVAVPSFPHNANGKIDRRALTEYL